MGPKIETVFDEGQLKTIQCALDFADEMFGTIQANCDWDEELIMQRLGWNPSTDQEYYNDMKDGLAESRGLLKNALRVDDES